MNNRFNQLLEESGFVFWQNETCGPGPGYIDWSCNYDLEIEEFLRLFTVKYKTNPIDKVVDVYRGGNDLTHRETGVGKIADAEKKNT